MLPNAVSESTATLSAALKARELAVAPKVLATAKEIITDNIKNMPKLTTSSMVEKPCFLRSCNHPFINFGRVCSSCVPLALSRRQSLMCLLFIVSLL